MATGTRNKRSVYQEMKAKRAARINQEAEHLTALMGHVDSIAAGTTGAAKEIGRLRKLGLTLAEIEHDTGISVHRLGTLTRQARAGENGTTWEGDEEGTVDSSDDVLAEDASQDQAEVPSSGQGSRPAGDDDPASEPLGQ